MSTPVDREGIFRGRITEYGLFEADSGAIAINVRCKLEAMWDADANDGQGEWMDWTPYDVYADGSIWVIKKDGTINKGQVQSLVESAGWNSDLGSVEQGTWVAAPCQFTIQEDSYRDEVRYRVAFVNAYDRVPGGMGTVSPERVAELKQRYGGQLRALAGNAARNAAPPPPEKPAPPKRPRPAKPAEDPNQDLQAAAAEAEAEDDGVPF